jgi:hypothetical protein
MKQVFAQRYNGLEGRVGHIWGDRYGSRILEGEPPENAGEAEHKSGNGDRPWKRKREHKPRFPLTSPFPPAPDPG